MAHKQGGRKAIKSPLDLRIEDYIDQMKFFMVLCSSPLRSQPGNAVHGHPPPCLKATLSGLCHRNCHTDSEALPTSLAESTLAGTPHVKIHFLLG